MYVWSLIRCTLKGVKMLIYATKKWMRLCSKNKKEMNETSSSPTVTVRYLLYS